MGTMDMYQFYIGVASFHEQLPAAFIFATFSVSAVGVQIIS